MEDYIVRTYQLQNLDRVAYWFSIVGLMAFNSFALIEVLQFLLPGNFFHVENINPALIHLGCASSLLCLVIGIALMRHVDKSFKNN